MAKALVCAPKRSHEWQSRCAGILPKQELQKADPDHRPEGVWGGDARRAAADQEGLPREAPVRGENLITDFLPARQNRGGDAHLDQKHWPDLPFQEPGGGR